jgi:hypothetical protein
MAAEITRRSALATLAGPAALSGEQPSATAPHVERWGMHEIVLQGARSGNPFVDVTLSAEFRFGHRTVEAAGFYDGAGVYRVRFMPDEIGDWQYTTKSNPDQKGDYRSAAGSTKDYYLIYFDLHQPVAYEFRLPPGGEYRRRGDRYLGDDRQRRAGHPHQHLQTDNAGEALHRRTASEGLVQYRRLIATVQS